MAVAEDAAITGYVVSWPLPSGFPLVQALTPSVSSHPGPVGVSKDHVSLYGPLVLGDHLTVRTSNGL